MKSLTRTISSFAALCCLGPAVAFATGNCTDHIDLTGLELPIQSTGTTLGATNDYGPFTEQPSCWQGNWDHVVAGGPDVTFKWTVPADQPGFYTFSLVRSVYNADLLIYDFTCPDEPLHPDDFICGSHRGLVSRGHVANVQLMGGQEILIVVDGWAQSAGEFELTIHDTRTLERSVRMVQDVYHLPAVTAALVHDQEVIWTGTEGLADIEAQRAVADTTVFLAMSVSKTLTGTAFMQLWEDGHVDLDSDINAYLPFEIHHPDYPEVPITARMLLSHVSGAADNWLDVFLTPGGDSPITLAELAYGYFHPDGQWYSAFTNFTDDAPGSRLHYSTFGIVLVAYLVECVNPESLTFIDYSQREIFDPLGMTRTSWLLSNLIANGEDLAVGYTWDGENLVPNPHYHAAWYAGAALRTTTPDLTRFMRAIMNGGEFQGTRILESATVDSMLTPQFTDVIQGENARGLSFERDVFGDHEVWGHTGTNPLASASMFFRRDTDPPHGEVMLASSGGEGGIGRNWLTTILLDAAIGVPTSAPDGLTGLPPAPVLRPCYPNPFNPRTTIAFELAAPGPTRLQIFDLRGRLVSTLVEETLPAGRHEVVWNGRDARGRAAASGCYVVRVTTGYGVEARKVMLAK